MPTPVLLSLGSNLADRRLALRRGVREVSGFIRVIRISSVFETAPIGCRSDAPEYLNIALAGLTHLAPLELLARLLDAEYRLGRRRRQRNDPRTIDLDIVMYGARLMRSERLTIPHPRFREREFVLAPLRELELGWMDPVSAAAIDRLRGEGLVRRDGTLY